MSGRVVSAHTRFQIIQDKIAEIGLLAPMSPHARMATPLDFHKLGGLVPSFALRLIKNSNRMLFVGEIWLDIDIFIIGGFYRDS